MGTTILYYTLKPQISRFRAFQILSDDPSEAWLGLQDFWVLDLGFRGILERPQNAVDFPEYGVPLTGFIGVK